MRYTCMKSKEICSPDIVMSTAVVMADKQRQLSTAPFDARFPNQNQTRHCWQNYVDFHRCLKIKGEDYEPCQYFKRVYRSLCPNGWVEKWDEQLEKGVFAGKI